MCDFKYLKTNVGIVSAPPPHGLGKFLLAFQFRF